jgi:hypothetical protein
MRIGLFVSLFFMTCSLIEPLYEFVDNEGSH